MGGTGYSRRNLGLGGSAKNAISPTNLAVILRQPLRFKIRARNGRIFLRRGVCFMFQSAIRCSDLMQSAPFSGLRRTASADLESDREIFGSRPEREVTI